MMKTITKLAIVAVILAVLAGIFAGCVNDTTKMSSKTLNITGAEKYNESAVREEFAREKAVAFATEGISEFTLVYKQEELKESAQTLAEYLRRIVGNVDSFKVSQSGESVGKKITLAIANNQDVIDDGYSLSIAADNIVISANNAQGVLNGVYGFLEDELECMFVRYDYDYLPSLATIYLDEKQYVSNPDFAWRKVFQKETQYQGWSDKIRLNGLSSEKENINHHNGWGTWCHNVFSFVNPKTYFDTNPEFYAYYKGERRAEYNGVETQLCLTNPDIYEVIRASMAKMIESNPEAKYWDFSINDNNFYCQCDACASVLEETGSMMGTMLPIINRLAKDFPDKIISTLAYFHNERVPKGIVCEDNVNITIAPIQTGQLYSYAYGNNAGSKKAKAIIEEWNQVSKSLLIWDYVIDFSHLLMPFPNLDVQADNIRFYKEHNVTAVFHQGSREHGDELANLRTYILSKQLWDMDIDVDKTLSKYLSVTYGSSADYIAQYLDEANRLVKTKAKNLDLYDAPNWHAFDYLSTGAIKGYQELITKALEAADNEVIRKRIEEIELNVVYAKMWETSFDIKGKKEAFERFQTLVVEQGITRPYETVPPNMDEFINEVYPAHLQFVEMAKILTICVPIIVVALGIGTFFLVRFLIKKKSKQKSI